MAKKGVWIAIKVATGDESGRGFEGLVSNF